MLNLTREERQIVVFLVIVFLSGAGINFLSKRFVPVQEIACVNPNLGKININTADKETLKLIPGIGEKLAARIIDYRRENGKFSKPEDLKNVLGVYNRTLEKNRDLILIE